MIKKRVLLNEKKFFFCVAFKCTDVAITKTFDFLSVILEKFFWLSEINEHYREYSAMTKLQVRLSVLIKWPL